MVSSFHKIIDDIRETVAGSYSVVAAQLNKIDAREIRNIMASIYEELAISYRLATEIQREIQNVDITEIKKGLEQAVKGAMVSVESFNKAFEKIRELRKQLEQVKQTEAPIKSESDYLEIIDEKEGQIAHLERVNKELWELVKSEKKIEEKPISKKNARKEQTATKDLTDETIRRSNKVIAKLHASPAKTKNRRN